MRVVEHISGCYEVREVEFGRVYRWRPGRVVIECTCGERSTLMASATTCGGCGADNAAIIRGELVTERLGDEVLHPWRYSGDQGGDAGIPC